MKYYLVEYGYDKNKIEGHWKCETYNRSTQVFAYFKYMYDYVVVWEMENDRYSKIVDEYNKIVDFDDWSVEDTENILMQEFTY